jgi:hypothetical protein
MASYHYLGDVPPASDYIGVFAPDLMAVVSVGLPNNVLGSQATASMAERGYHKVPDAITAKHVYILPIGPQASAIRQRLAPFTQPYPKRAAA